MNQSNLSYKTNTLIDGKYQGHDFLCEVFLLKRNDTVFVDFISIDKFPRELIRDTILLKLKDCNEWEGRTLRLLKLKKGFYIEYQSPLLEDVKDNIKVRLNEDFYDKYHESLIRPFLNRPKQYVN